MMIKSKHPHAFVSSKFNLLYKIMISPPNSFYLPPQSEDSTFLVDIITMVMRKKFLYIKQFNNLWVYKQLLLIKFFLFSISHMISSGMFDYWQSNQFNRIKKFKKKLDQNEIDYSFKPLSNFHLQSAYYLFLFGICISILSIFTEIYLFYITLIRTFNFCF